jgi:hypothetical protein
MYASSTLVTHIILVLMFYQIFGITVVFDSFSEARPLTGSRMLWL